MDSSNDIAVLIDKAEWLGLNGHHDEAIAAYDEVVGRVGAGLHPKLRERVANALIAVYDEAVAQVGAASTAQRDWVANALLKKGVTLAKLGCYDASIAVYDDLVARFGTARDLRLREWVALALLHKGITLRDYNRLEEAIAVYDNLVARFGTARELTLRKLVGEALIDKANELRDRTYLDKANRVKAIAIYDDVIDRFEAEHELGLRSLVAKALINKGAYDEVVSRFGTARALPLRELVAKALIRKWQVDGRLLADVEGAITVCDELVRRFGTSRELPLRELVVQALLNKGNTLHNCCRYKEEVAVYDDIIRQFGTANEPTLRELVSEAKRNRRSGEYAFKERLGLPLERPTAQVIELPRRLSTRPIKGIVASVLQTPYVVNDISSRRAVEGTKTTTANEVDNASAIKTDERGIPLTAPAKWPGKWHSDVPVDDFFRKWWGKYLRKGLTIEDVKRLDRKLGNTLKGHFQNRLPWPEDLKFRNERKDLRWAVEQFKQGNVEVLTPKQLIAVGRFLNREEQKKSAAGAARLQKLQR